MNTQHSDMDQTTLGSLYLVPITEETAIPDGHLIVVNWCEDRQHWVYHDRLHIGGRWLDPERAGLLAMMQTEPKTTYSYYLNLKVLIDTIPAPERQKTPSEVIAELTEQNDKLKRTVASLQDMLETTEKQ